MEFILENLKSIGVAQQVILLMLLHLVIPMVLILLDKASFANGSYLSRSQSVVLKENMGILGSSSVENSIKDATVKINNENIGEHVHINEKSEDDLSVKNKSSSKIEKMHAEVDEKHTDIFGNQDNVYNFENIDAVNDYISKSSTAKVECQPYIRNNPRMIKVTRGAKKYAKPTSFISLGRIAKKNKKHFGTNTSIYIIQSPFKTNSGFEVKVGESTNFDNRVKTYRQYWRNLFNVIAKFDGTVSDEKYIQDLLSRFHISGEFYDLSSTQISAIKNMKTLSEFEDYFL